VAIVKKQLGLEPSLHQIHQILGATIFEKNPILEGFLNFSDTSSAEEARMQLNLFDLR
jgi:predicted RNA-binding protein (virulence factor B family)